MSKNSREKVWKATTKTNHQPIKKTFDDDISNLNNDNSFVPIEEEEETLPLTEEEKQEVRKKLFVLLIAIVVVLFLLIIILIFDPFKSKDKDSEDKKVETVEQENTDDDQEDPKTISLLELENGNIDLNNSEIKQLESEIIFKQYEYYENDTISLYKSNSVNISSLTNKDKLFLLTKTSDFNSLIKKMIVNDSICNSTLTIKTSTIDSLLKNRFNTKVTSYDDFTYSYYEGDSYIKTIKFTKTNDEYIGKCYEPKKNVTNVSQQVVTNAIKENQKLYIDCKVVFVKQDGVFKDPTFKTLITNDKTKALDEYIDSGNTYRYTFDISSSNYYLINVTLIK